MRKVLALDPRWEKVQDQFAEHEIKVISRRKQGEPVDAVLMPASAWPPRDVGAPLLVYGSRAEIRPLFRQRARPGCYWSETAALDNVAQVVGHLRTLWREGHGGRELALEEKLSILPEKAPQLHLVAHHWADGKTREESARILGTTVGTIRHQRSIIRKILGADFPQQFLRQG